jgi:hypothetical protein
MISYFVLDITSYYPEFFKIQKVKLSLFKSVRNENGYWDLNNVNSFVADSDNVILCINFKPEYISLRHEHPFINKPVAPFGAYGHIDSIEFAEITFQYGDSQTVVKTMNAEKFKYFYLRGLLDTVGSRHSSVIANNNKSIYEAKTYESLENFRVVYNLKRETYNFIANFEDCHFFRIANLDELKNRVGNIKIKFSLNDGSILEDSLTIGNVFK